jgi:hypothetical protein
VDVERCARSVRAVVTVATPHRGTPVAHFFNNLLGQQILKLLSISTMYTLRAGRLPVGAVLRLLKLIRSPGARAQGVVEQIFAELVADFSIDRRRAIEEFFLSIRGDQDLVAQITPAAMELFNASTQDRLTVRYGCVVTRAHPPGLASAVRAGVGLYAQATHAVYVALHRIAHGGARSTAPGRRDAPASPADLQGNDGIVPTASQLWGDLIAAVWADHLDVIGHFHHPKHVPPHFDWLVSGTGFTRPQFERLWKKIVVWLAVRRGEATGGASSR